MHSSGTAISNPLPFLVLLWFQECTIKAQDGFERATRPFLWNGQNYLMSILRDTNFLAESPVLRETLGRVIHLRNNPLLLAPGVLRNLGATGVATEDIPAVRHTLAPSRSSRAGLRSPASAHSLKRTGTTVAGSISSAAATPWHCHSLFRRNQPVSCSTPASKQQTSLTLPEALWIP